MPCCVVHCCNLTTVLGMAQLGEKEGSRGLRNGTSETDEETGSNEHAEALRSCLERNTEHHEEDTGDNGQTTAKVIGDVGTITFLACSIIRKTSELKNSREWKTANGSNTHNGIEETQDGSTRMVEVGLPRRDHLETVHHRTL